jgi:hypothetical protein
MNSPKASLSSGLLVSLSVLSFGLLLLLISSFNCSFGYTLMSTLLLSNSRPGRVLTEVRSPKRWTDNGQGKPNKKEPLSALTKYYSPFVSFILHTMFRNDRSISKFLLELFLDPGRSSVQQ